MPATEWFLEDAGILAVKSAHKPSQGFNSVNPVKLGGRMLSLTFVHIEKYQVVGGQGSNLESTEQSSELTFDAG